MMQMTMPAKFALPNFDKEDADYLEQCLKSLLSESKEEEKKTLANFKADTFNKSSFDLRTQSNEFQITNNRSEASNEGCNSKIKDFKNKQFQVNYYDSNVSFQDLIENGVDNEDVQYLKSSLVSLSLDPKESYWASKTKWDSHLNSYLLEGHGVKADLPAHKTGCARTEGFYKLDKLSISISKKVQKAVSSPDVVKRGRAPYSRSYKGNKKTLSRDARNDQRRLLTAYETITHSNLLNLNELKFRKKKTRLAKSEIHGLGLFACEPIAPNEIIMEYVGQIIRPVIADLREKVYKSSGLGSYCFRIDDGTIIDATKYGNLNRFINHSCNPNSYARILMINNQKKIVIYSKRAIKVDEEISYDYKMPFEDDKVVCLCRSPGCRRSLN